jgi:Flp pilus assembly protein TadG
MKNFLQFLRCESGSPAVEFAILSVPMLMICGIVFFAGIGFYSQTSLTFATQQAALASVAGQGADGQTVFAKNVPNTLTGTAMACTQGSGSTTCNASGSIMVPFAGLFNANDTMTLTATATAATPAPKP